MQYLILRKLFTAFAIVGLRSDITAVFDRSTISCNDQLTRMIPQLTSHLYNFYSPPIFLNNSYGTRWTFDRISTSMLHIGVASLEGTQYQKCLEFPLEGPSACVAILLLIYFGASIVLGPTITDTAVATTIMPHRRSYESQRFNVHQLF
ncbi:hypothetical protein TNCV_3758681 [Trichonephila clavipes]|nr:hypothetical protein TNCV_3758681 [Trichonephila clavipes]